MVGHCRRGVQSNLVLFGVYNINVFNMADRLIVLDKVVNANPKIRTRATLFRSIYGGIQN